MTKGGIHNQEHSDWEGFVCSCGFTCKWKKDFDKHRRDKNRKVESHRFNPHEEYDSSNLPYNWKCPFPPNGRRR